MHFLIGDADTSNHKPRNVQSHSEGQMITTKSQHSEFYNVQEKKPEGI